MLFLGIVKICWDMNQQPNVNFIRSVNLPSTESNQIGWWARNFQHVSLNPRMGRVARTHQNGKKWNHNIYICFFLHLLQIYVYVYIYIYIYICLIGGFAASSKNSSAVFPQTKLHFFNVCNLKGHAKRCVFLRFSLVSLVLTSGCR